MNWLKISLFGLGLAVIVGPGCSDKGSNPSPIILGGATGTGGTIGAGGASGASGTTGTEDAGGVTAPDAGVDSGSVILGDAGSGGTCVATKTGHLAIINAPTTGGLDVPGPTPPAYETCK